MSGVNGRPEFRILPVFSVTVSMIFLAAVPCILLASFHFMWLRGGGTFFVFAVSFSLASVVL